MTREVEVSGKNENAILREMGTGAVKLLREMIALNDRYSNDYDAAFTEGNSDGMHKAMYASLGTLNCITFAAQIFAPTTHPDEFINMLREQTE